MIKLIRRLFGRVVDRSCEIECLSGAEVIMLMSEKVRRKQEAIRARGEYLRERAWVKTYDEIFERRGW